MTSQSWYSQASGVILGIKIHVFIQANFRSVVCLLFFIFFEYKLIERQLTKNEGAKISEFL